MTVGRSRSTRSAPAAASAIILIALCLCLVAAIARGSDSTACYVGTYQLSVGGFVDIAPTDSNTRRWRRFDGTTGALTEKQGGLWTSTYGWTERPDGKSVRFSDCEAGRINFDGEEGRRIRFAVRDTTFLSHGVTLAGRLILPQGAAVVPIVILLHGAEHDSARQFNPLQRMLPAAGVGAFVFDKRGTGGSSGSYSQDFNLLADDAVAAMREAKRLSGKRSGRIGYQSGSQSGWVAPLAANRAHVDFVIACFGLAVSVIDEDQQEVEIEMREKGHSRAEIASAQEVARAAENIFASGFTEGFAEFDAVRAKYQDAPWFKDLHGNYTHPHDACAHARHVKAYFFQRPSHHAIQFIAPATTSLADDLVVACRQIQNDGTMQEHVEIFERDRVLMSAMHGFESREIRTHAAPKTDALQIGRKLQ